MTVPSIGESGSVLSPKSSPLMEFDEDDLTQLAEGEFYATPRHVGRVHGGIANYLLQQHRLESRRQTGKNITFEEKDQAVVLSAVDRWKHPGLQAAANDLAKDMGYLVEEADRFGTWTILKRLERGESVPALYADEDFLRGVIYLILKRDSNPHAPTRAEYNEFLKMRGKSLVSAPLLSTGGMMQYSLHSVVPGMLAAARRCISERTIPKLKLYILAVLREEKERQGYMKLSRKQSEALLAEQRDILAALSGGESLAAINDRQDLKEMEQALGPLIQAGKAVSEKASRKKLLALALEDAANYHHALPVLCSISKKLEALHKAKEDIYNSTTDKEIRKAMVKQLPLAQRMAKNAFNLFPQYTVQPSHLNFNSDFSKVLLRAMGFQPPSTCNSDNMLWFSSFVELNGEDHVYPNSSREGQRAPSRARHDCDRLSNGQSSERMEWILQKGGGQDYHHRADASRLYSPASANRSLKA